MVQNLVQWLWVKLRYKKLLMSDFFFFSSSLAWSTLPHTSPSHYINNHTEFGKKDSIYLLFHRYFISLYFLDSSSGNIMNLGLQFYSPHTYIHRPTIYTLIVTSHYHTANSSGYSHCLNGWSSVTKAHNAGLQVGPKRWRW